MSEVAIAILAAGVSARLGAPKQLQRLAGTSLVRRAALTALASGCPVSVVTGARAEDVAAELHALPVQLQHNADWAQGMGGSLALAARSTGANIGAVLVMLADQPLVETRDLHALLDEHAAHPEAIVAADHGAALGPPCLFPARYLPALTALSGDRGARALLKQHADAVRRVAMTQAALDIDTPQDLARAQALLAARDSSGAISS